MQDKRNSKLDQALVDKAWLQMQEQLEVAMPQRKRRAFWWWWAGAIGVCLLLLTAFMLNTKPLGTQLQIAPPAAPRVVTETQPVANAELEEQHPENTTNVTTGQRPEAVVQEQNSPGLNTTVLEKRALINTPAASASESVTSNLTAPATTKLVVATVAPAADNQEESVSITMTDVETTSEALTDVSRATMDAVANLPSVTPPLLSLASSFPAKVTPVSSPKQWHYYLETQGGFSLSTTDYNSFALGAGVQRDIGNKFHAELGVQYQVNRRSLFDNTNSDLVSLEEFSGSLGSQYALSVSAAYQNLQTTRYSAYLVGGYSLSPRWSVSGGIQASYFAKAYTVFGGEGTGVSEPATGEANGQRVDLYENTLSVYDLDTVTNAVRGPYPLNANRWQWSLNTSVHYRFAQRWEANLRYQRHLTAWPNKDEQFGGLDALQFGLRFYLR